LSSCRDNLRRKEREILSPQLICPQFACAN
jgi:hypothetical protein